MSAPAGTPISALSQLRNQLASEQQGAQGAGGGLAGLRDLLSEASTAGSDFAGEDGLGAGIDENATPVSEPGRLGDMPPIQRRAAFGAALGRDTSSDFLTDNIFTSTAAAFASGLLDSFPVDLATKAIDTIITPAELVTNSLIVDPNDEGAQAAVAKIREKLDEVIQGGTVADVSEWLGRELPFMLVSLGMMNIGRAIVMKSAPLISSRAAGFLAKSAEARATGNLVGPLTMRERMFHTTGHSLGFSAAEMARSGIEGKDLETVLKDGAIAGAFGFAFESGISGFAKFLSPRFRAKDLTKLKAKSGLRQKAHDAAVLDIIDRGEVKIAELAEANLSRFETSILDAVKGKTPFERRNDFLRMIDDANARRLSEGPLVRPKSENPVTRHTLPTFKADILERDIIKLKQDMIALENGQLVDPHLLRIIDDTPINVEHRIAELETAASAKQARITGVPIKDLDASLRDTMPWFKVTHARLVSAPDKMRIRGLNIYKTLLEDTRLKWFTSPDGFARRMGISGLRMLSVLEESDTAIAVGKDLIRERLVNTSATLVSQMEAAGKGLGRLNKAGHKSLTKAQLKDHKFLEPVRDTFEAAAPGEGRAAVAAEFGDDVAGTWMASVDENLNGLANKLEEAGVLVKMTEGALGRLEVGNYFPHRLPDSVIRAGSRNAMIAQVMKRSGITKMEAEHLIDTAGFSADGLRIFGNLTIQRQIAGTTGAINKNLAKKGDIFNKTTDFFEADPIRAMQRQAEDVLVRWEMGSRFGFEGEVGKYLGKAMVAEGAGEAEAEMLVNSILFRRPSNGARDALYNDISNIQVGTKLVYAVIPNFFQTVNTVTAFGMRASIKGFAKFLKKENREEMLRALDMIERSIASSSHAFAGREAVTLTDKIAEFVLKYSFFSATEQANRVLAALVGQEFVAQTLKKAVEGRLRGTAVQTARRGFAQLGLNFDVLAARTPGRAGKIVLDGDSIKTLVRNAVRRTQFASSAADLPIMWRTPGGRVITQFKSFAFNQTRFLTDQVFVEAAAGNYKPLAYFISMYPLVGELVGDLSAAAKGRQRSTDGLYRVVENVAHLGGFGLALNTVNAVIYNRPLEFLGGPTVSDALGFVSVMSSTLQGGPDEGARRLGQVVGGMPLGKLIGGIAMASDEVGAEAFDLGMDIIDNRGRAGDEATFSQSLDQLRLNRAKEKSSEGNRR